MRRRFRMLLIVPVILVLVAAAGSIVLSVFYADDVKQALIGRLNKHMRAEINVKDFGFSLWRHFPFVSFELNHVLVRDPLDATKKDTLLQAEKISLLFDATGLFRDDIIIRKIVADDGVLHVVIDKEGKANYEIWESDSTGQSKGIDLSMVQLNEMRLTFLEHRSKQDYDFKTDRIEFSGTFRESRFDMGVKGDFQVIRLSSDGTVYVENKSAVIDASLDVDGKSGNYKLGDCTVKLADVDFSVNGNFMMAEKTTLDLQVSSGKAALQNFISLLPVKYAGKLKAFKADGELEFRSSIKGENSKDKSPVFRASFSVEDGSLLPDGQDVAMKKIRLSGAYESGRNGMLHIKGLNAVLGAYPVQADMKITDMEQPYIDVHAKSTIDLSTLKGFLRWDTLESLSGIARVNIAFSGRLKNFQKGVVAGSDGINSSGSVELSDVAFRLKDNPLQFKSINAQLSLINEVVQVKNMKGNISSTDFSVNGSINNLIGFLLVNDQSASFKADFSAAKIDLDELLLNKSKTNI
ncbi:MAG: AsmA family protein, partial [Bacteroidota bacterium]